MVGGRKLNLFFCYALSLPGKKFTWKFFDMSNQLTLSATFQISTVIVEPPFLDLNIIGGGLEMGIN